MVPVDGVSGKLVLHDKTDVLLLRLLYVQGIDIGAGHHDLLDRTVHEIEDAVDQLFFGPVEDALKPPLFQQHLDLVLPDHLVGLLQFQHPHDKIRGKVEYPNGKEERLRKKNEGRHQMEGCTLPVVDPYILGHKLTGHHDEIGQDDDDEDKGERSRRRGPTYGILLKRGST